MNEHTRQYLLWKIFCVKSNSKKCKEKLLSIIFIKMSTTDIKGLTNSLEKDLMANILNWMIMAQKTLGWNGDEKSSFVLTKVKFYLGNTEYEIYKGLVIEIISTVKLIVNNKQLRNQFQRLSNNCGNIFGC